MDGVYFLPLSSQKLLVLISLKKTLNNTQQEYKIYNVNQTRNKINPEWFKFNQNIPLAKFSPKWGTMPMEKWPAAKEKLRKS